MRRSSRKWESHLLQECCPAPSAGSLYDLRTCREAVRTLERKSWHLNYHLVLPYYTQGWHWGSVHWHPEVLLCIVSAEEKEQGSTLGIASCRAGWLSVNQTTKYMCRWATSQNGEGSWDKIQGREKIFYRLNKIFAEQWASVRENSKGGTLCRE